MTRPSRPRPAPIPATVVRTQRLSPTLTRVVLGGPELRRFTPSPHSDSYVKLAFLVPGVDYPRPLDMERIRAELPPEQWPVVRTYTVRSFDVDATELTIDFVVHGDAGIAGPWAAAAKPGDEIMVSGPGGAYSPSASAGFHLSIGDESALPAIATALAALHADAVGQVLIGVEHESSRIDVQAPPGVRIDWVIASGRPVGEALVEAAAAVEFPAATVDAFVHGEAGFVKELRRLLRVDRGVPREQLSISGYWRIGATEEGWRAAKAQWNQEAEATEIAAGVS